MSYTHDHGEVSAVLRPIRDVPGLERPSSAGNQYMVK